LILDKNNKTYIGKKTAFLVNVAGKIGYSPVGD
jgi:hypothetical protein